MGCDMAFVYIFRKWCKIRNIAVKPNLEWVKSYGLFTFYSLRLHQNLNMNLLYSYGFVYITKFRLHFIAWGYVKFKINLLYLYGFVYNT